LGTLTTVRNTLLHARPGHSSRGEIAATAANPRRQRRPERGAGRRLRALGRAAVGRQRPRGDDAVQARDDLGGGEQPQRAVADLEHVGLPGELQQPADDADGQLGRAPVAGAPPDRQQQLDDRGAGGGPGVAAGGDGRRRQGRRRRQPADDRHPRTRGHVALTAQARARDSFMGGGGFKKI